MSCAASCDLPNAFFSVPTRLLAQQPGALPQQVETRFLCRLNVAVLIESMLISDDCLCDTPSTYFLFFFLSYTD